jgi:hypothetical protein
MTAPRESSSRPALRTFLAQEIRNRFLSLPPERRSDPCAAIARITAELMEELS